MAKKDPTIGQAVVELVDQAQGARVGSSYVPGAPIRRAGEPPWAGAAPEPVVPLLPGEER
jgi:hypothetical protein